jgi:hypothetical protein
VKYLKWVIGGMLAIVPVFAVVSLAQAQRFSANIEKDQKVYSSLYSSGKQISVHGEIFGDVFCAGRTIVIDAIVHGDVICAGQDVTINGIIEGDARIAGQEVVIDATIMHSATVASTKFSLDAEAKIGQDLTVFGGESNIKGGVARDVTASGSPVTINGPIGRNLTVTSQVITLKDNAKLGGNLNYTGTVKPALDKHADVQGEVVQHQPKERRGGPIFNPVFYLFVLVSLLIIAMLIAGLFPAYLQRTSGLIMDSPILSIGVGGIASLLAPLIMAGVGFTIIGLPLALVLLLVMLLMLVLSGPVVAYALGRLLLRRTKSPVALISAGSVLLVTAYFIPLAGLVSMVIAFWLGLGAILRDLHSRSRLATPENN